MKTFILSAGLGTRLRPITNKIPKVLVKIGNKPVLEHLILLCKKQGIKDIIINLHHFPEKIKKYFGHGQKLGVNIIYSYEPKIMGGAGALKKVEKYLDKSFMVMNGDVITNLNLTRLINFHKKKAGICTFIVHKSDHPYDSDLVDVDDNWQVTKFIGKPKPDQKFKNLTKSGTHIFEPEVLKYIPKKKEYSLEGKLLPNLIKRGLPVFAYYTEEYSHDMGTHERLARVRKDYQEGKIG